MANITREEHEILSYVSKFGCLDIEQLKILMQPLESRHVVTLVNCLIKKKVLSVIASRYLVTINSKVSRPVISCIWAMLELDSSKNDFSESMRAVFPADIFFTIRRKDSFDVMFINEGNLNKIALLQERYLEKECSKKRSLIHTVPVFVVDDASNKQLILKIKESGFSFPFILAIIAYGDAERPSIKLAKSVSQS